MERNNITTPEILRRFSKLKIGDLWGKVSELPEDLKRDIENVVRFFHSSDHESRTSISASIKPNYSFLFLWFGKEMSIRAVRDNNEHLIFDGLTALAIENAIFDLREDIVVMSLLCHSAIKLGADASSLFLRASQLAEHKGLAEELITFPKRPPQKRLINYFNYAESGQGEKFSYAPLA